MSYIKAFETAGDNLIEGIRTAQDLTLAAVEGARKAVAEYVPNVTGFTSPLKTEQLPLREVTESTFRFWHRVAENQKHFALRLIDALEPANGRTKKTE